MDAEIVADLLTKPELCGALVAALGELDDQKRDKVADIKGKEGKAGYKYTYADLASALGDIRPILAAHGLGVIQTVPIVNGTVTVTTILIHKSGQALAVPGVTMTAGNPKDPQAVGSMITYARRYSLLPALGIATEDDDGAKGSKQAPREQPPEPVYHGPTQEMTDKLIAEFKRVGLDAPAERADYLAATLGMETAPRWTDLLLADAQKVLDDLAKLEDCAP
jgi:hypothetical protein